MVSEKDTGGKINASDLRRRLFHGRDTQKSLVKCETC